jgi:hypothetical protein
MTIRFSRRTLLHGVNQSVHSQLRGATSSLIPGEEETEGEFQNGGLKGGSDRGMEKTAK